MSKKRKGHGMDVSTEKRKKGRWRIYIDVYES